MYYSISKKFNLLVDLVLEVYDDSKFLVRVEILKEVYHN